MQSIHSQIPRRLPRTFYEHIGRLALVDINFQSFSHLANLLRDLVDLWSFHGSRLTWKQETRLLAAPSGASRVRPRHFPNTIFSLSACPSGQHWLAFLLTGWLSLSDEPCVLTRCVDEHLRDVGWFQLPMPHWHTHHCELRKLKVLYPASRSSDTMQQKSCGHK